jgi:hypothetical protein
MSGLNEELIFDGTAKPRHQKSVLHFTANP